MQPTPKEHKTVVREGELHEARKKFFPASLPREPLVGDVYEFKTVVLTPNGKCIGRGTQIRLIAETSEAPYGFYDPYRNNFVAEVDGVRSVWSSVRYLIEDGILALRSPS